MFFGCLFLDKTWCEFWDFYWLVWGLFLTWFLYEISIVVGQFSALLLLFLIFQLKLLCVYCCVWKSDLSRVWCNWLLPHFNFADRVFCHSCHNFRVPLFLKVRHNAGLTMREIVSNLQVCIEIQTSLYTLVYTLFLDNDK